MDKKFADINMIKRIIPHRYPFLLIDRVTDIIPSKEAVGRKNVTFNEPHFQGHFPDSPIMPGVMVVEAMAQTAAVLVGLSGQMIDNNFLVYFMSIDKCRFRRKIIPGDILCLHITVLRGKLGSKVWKFRGLAKVDGVVATEAEFTAMIDNSEK